MDKPPQATGPAANAKPRGGQRRAWQQQGVRADQQTVCEEGDKPSTAGRVCERDRSLTERPLAEARAIALSLVHLAYMNWLRERGREGVCGCAAEASAAHAAENERLSADVSRLARDAETRERRLAELERELTAANEAVAATVVYACARVHMHMQAVAATMVYADFACPDARRCADSYRSSALPPRPHQSCDYSSVLRAAAAHSCVA